MSSPCFHGIGDRCGANLATRAGSYDGGYYYTYGYRRTEPQEPPKGNEVSE